jgi:hypothetical protein
VVLDGIKYNYFNSDFKMWWADNMIALNIPKDIILKAVAAKTKLGQHFFNLVWELSDRNLYSFDCL